MSQPGNYPKNRAAVEAHRPQMLPWLDHARYDPDRYQLLKTQTPYPTIKVVPPDGPPYLCYSQVNPVQNVEQQLGAIDRKTPYAPYLFGLGAGYALRMMYDRFAHEFHDMVVVERDPVFLRIAFELLDFTDVIADKRCFFFLGEQVTHWQELLSHRLPSITTSRLEILPLCPAVPQMPFYRSLMEQLQMRVTTAEAEIRLLIQQGDQIQKNTILNLPAIAEATGINSLQDQWKDKPAIVVAAGPSLDRNVEQLKDIGNRVPIMVVDTALRTLLRHGITPHFVISTDPSELNRRHFETLELPERSALICEEELYWEICRMWKGPIIHSSLEKTEIGRWIDAQLGPFGFVRKGLSVGNAAFLFAALMGADPLILVGFDLAYDQQGGKTHTGDAALFREYDSFSQGSSQHLLGKRPDGAEASKETIVWVPGTQHDRVPTSQVMSLYINQLEQDIAQQAATVIDATEGGARFAGTVVQTLQETLAGLPQTDTSPWSLLPQQQVAPSMDTLRTQLPGIREALVVGRSNAEEGLTFVDTVLQQTHLGEALRKTEPWKAMEQCFNGLHGDKTIKLMMEPILFEAFFAFVKKEWPYQVHIRAGKYRQYFDAFLKHQPRVLEWIDQVIAELNDSANA